MKQEKAKASNIWICPNCKGDPEFEHGPMMEHLKSVHGIDPKTTKGNRSMLMHLDCEETFSSQYEWTIGTLKFLQHTVSLRAKDDPMRFA